jgi:putative restriction endonuclease
MLPGKRQLLNRVREALRLSGWQLLWLNDEHPARARFLKADQAIDTWIYIWNLTTGGRPDTRPDERRIQPTNIDDHFRAENGIQTLIFGWSAEVEVFAAFDYRFHQGQLGTSPSIQTDLAALKAAVQDGIGVYSKSTGELSIAVRPDLIGLYVEQMITLHDSGNDPAQLAALRQMASDPLDIEPDDLPASRREVMSTTLRRLRNSRFSEQVLGAYSHRCAFCGIQLRLLDAAHIVPVKHPASNDKVTNGVALCALHHRAYDAALVTFNTDYSIRISQEKTAKLSADGQGKGLDQFTAALRPSLLLPHTQANRPSPQMIAKANVLRGWA